MNIVNSFLSGLVLSMVTSIVLAEPIVMSEPVKLIEQQMDSVTAAGTAAAGAIAQGDLRGVTRTSARVNNAAIATGLAIGVGENSTASADAYTIGSKDIIKKNINIKVDGRVHINIALSGSLK